MTKNQIEYAKLKETQRSNKAQEALTDARDQAARIQRATELVEIGRHNLATEAYARANLDESSRANQAREAIQRMTHDELMRHNQQTERLSIDQLAESVRHSKVLEEQSERDVTTREEAHRENVRSHQASEALQSRQIAVNLGQLKVAQQQAATAQFQAETGRLSQQETVRSNVAKEVEARRHNVEQESLTRQANTYSFTTKSKANEIQAQYNAQVVDLRNRELQETQRSHLASEKLTEVGQNKRVLGDTLQAVPRIVSLF